MLMPSGPVELLFLLFRMAADICVYFRSLLQAVRIYSVAFYDISLILHSAAALFRQ